uniref:Uncharacterized protein n=1 Tax=Mola mola TaxID=94237 RepID=A0A3Q3XME3_MOLML
MDRELNLNRAETFSFVNPWIRYFLFFFSFLFWVSAMFLHGGCYVPIFLPDTVRDTFLIDPAVILIVVGVVMFFITFCGCIGALRENTRLLKTVITDTLLIRWRCVFLSDTVTRDALGKFVKKAIVHYRDDLDLQNLMDYIQKEVLWPAPLNPSSERCAVPYSCCTPVPGEAVINTMCGFGVQTQNYLEAVKSIYPVGCADKAVMWIESHLLLVGALTLGLAFCEILLRNTSSISTCSEMLNTYKRQRPYQNLSV